tara:strand:- start:889 stop:1473 length:585 start_codon:yes stop_codon:yes gene_type:complete
MNSIVEYFPISKNNQILKLEKEMMEKQKIIDQLKEDINGAKTLLFTNLDLCKEANAELFEDWIMEYMHFDEAIVYSSDSSDIESNTDDSEEDKYIPNYDCLEILGDDSNPIELEIKPVLSDKDIAFIKKHTPNKNRTYKYGIKGVGLVSNGNRYQFRGMSWLNRAMFNKTFANNELSRAKQYARRFWEKYPKID